MREDFAAALEKLREEFIIGRDLSNEETLEVFEAAALKLRRDMIDLEAEATDVGNGAREALERYFREQHAPLPKQDHLLAWLWVEGFKVVPLPAEPE